MVTQTAQILEEDRLLFVLVVKEFCFSVNMALIEWPVLLFTASVLSFGIIRRLYNVQQSISLHLKVIINLRTAAVKVNLEDPA